MTSPAARSFVTPFAAGPWRAHRTIIDNDRVIRRRSRATGQSASPASSAVVGHAQTPPATSDPLARAIAEAASAFAAETSTDPLWTDAKGGIETSLNDAQRALAAGRRWFALERLSQARQSLLATRFALRHPAERARPRGVRTRVDAPRRDAWERGARAGPLDTMRPAALRALAEVAMPQVRINYDAGLEYGRNTQPEYGLYYVGVADAQRQFVALARTLTAPAGDATHGAAAAIDRRRDRGRPARSARAVSATRVHRAAQRVHRRQFGAEGGAAVRRAGPALRRPAPVPAGRAADGHASHRRRPRRRGHRELS